MSKATESEKTTTAKKEKASDTIKVGGDKPEQKVSGADEPEVTAQERKAETIMASEAQPLESEIAVNSDGETETQFLRRLMLIQREGGWGRHLDGVILERIEKLNGVERKSADNVEA